MQLSSIVGCRHLVSKRPIVGHPHLERREERREGEEEGGGGRGRGRRRVEEGRRRVEEGRRGRRKEETQSRIVMVLKGMYVQTCQTISRSTVLLNLVLRLLSDPSRGVWI